MRAFFAKIHRAIWTRKIKALVKLSRWIIEAQLLWLVYQEAGPWTAGTLALMGITLEMTASWVDKTKRAISVIAASTMALEMDFKNRKQGKMRKELRKR